jgi:hypothetical protein
LRFHRRATRKSPIMSPIAGFSRGRMSLSS